MTKGIQHLVNAQTEVNRAVWMSNADPCTEGYIDERIKEAIKFLKKAAEQRRKK